MEIKGQHSEQNVVRHYEVQLDWLQNPNVHSQVFPVCRTNEVDEDQTESKGKELVENVASNISVTEAFIEYFGV